MGELKCGVYCLYWANSAYYYYGKSGDIYGRYKSHMNELKKGKHPNKKLMEAFIKCGEPLVKIMEECEYEDLNNIEMTYIKPLGADTYLCNAYVGKTPLRLRPKKKFTVAISKHHYRAIRIKFKTIVGFIEAYIDAGMPDLKPK